MDINTSNPFPSLTIITECQVWKASSGEVLNHLRKPNSKILCEIYDEDRRTRALLIRYRNNDHNRLTEVQALLLGTDMKKIE
jgi:hypothetical protein